MQPHHNGFTEDAADAAASMEGEGLADELSMDDDSFEDDAFEADGFEEDAADDDAMDDDDAFAGDDAMAADDAADDDAFEDDGLDEDALAASGDEVDDAGIDADGWDEGDALADDGEAIDAIFFDTLDGGEDEFWRQLIGRGLRGLGGLASRVPTAQAPWQLAGQVVSRLPIPHAGEIGTVLGAAGPHVAQTSPYLYNWANRVDPQQMDAMDLYADGMLDYAGDDLEAFAPQLGGFAGRFAVKATVAPRKRAAKKAQVKRIAKATAKAVEASTRKLIRKAGPRAASVVPKIVRNVVKLVVARRASPKSLPRLIARTTAKVLRSPAAVKRLARPSKAVRRARVRAGIRPGAPVKGYAPSRLRPMRRRARGIRTITIQGPVRLSFRR